MNCLMLTAYSVTLIKVPYRKSTVLGLTSVYFSMDRRILRLWLDWCFGGNYDPDL